MRVVLFDVDGVLIHGYGGEAPRRRRWDEHLQADLGIDPERFKALFIKDVFERDVLTGRKALLTALEETLPALGFRGSPLAVAGYWLDRDSQVNLQLLEIVRGLRRAAGIKLYIATNQEHLRAFHLWHRLGFGLLFDDLFHSARLGVLKPDPAFYQRIEEIIGPQVEPPLIFDDSQAVILGARAFGWEGVLYNELDDCLSHPWIAHVLAAGRPGPIPAR